MSFHGGASLEILEEFHRLTVDPCNARAPLRGNGIHVVIFARVVSLRIRNRHRTQCPVRRDTTPDGLRSGAEHRRRIGASTEPDRGSPLVESFGHRALEKGAQLFGAFAQISFPADAKGRRSPRPHRLQSSFRRPLDRAPRGHRADILETGEVTSAEETTGGDGNGGEIDVGPYAGMGANRTRGRRDHEQRRRDVIMERSPANIVA